MGRIKGREPQETRQLILDAASALLLTDGLAASLEQIAARAGVSKGGLKYHFVSKGELLDALASRFVQVFRDKVAACTDPADAEPGALIRGYIRASVDPDVDESLARDRNALEVLLGTVSSVKQIWRDDDEWWEQRLSSDGLEEGLQDVVVAAADGAAAAHRWGEPWNPRRIRALRDRLIALTRTQGAVAPDAVSPPGASRRS